MKRRNERGQATPLLVVIVMVAMLTALLVAAVGRVMIARSEAQATADAAALAAVVGGEAVAEQLFVEEGVSVELEPVADGFSATAVVDGVSASARAVGQPAEVAVAPALVAILARLEQLVDDQISWQPIDVFTITVAPDRAEAIEAYATTMGLCRLESPAGGAFFRLCLGEE